MGKRKEPDKPDARQTVWGKKGKNLNVRLTEEAWVLAKERAKELGTSVSEVIERWARRYDVNFDDAVPIPPNLDSRASAVKSMSALELHEALGEKIESQQSLLDDLLDGKLTDADVAEVTGLLDLEDSKAEKLRLAAQFFRGGKKLNGV